VEIFCTLISLAALQHPIRHVALAREQPRCVTFQEPSQSAPMPLPLR
jgi:hypothetical protein